MNTAAPTMGDDDIRAFTNPGPAQPAAPTPRRRRWPWVLLALGLLGLAMLLALGHLAWHEMHGLHGMAGVGDWQVGIGPEGWHGDLGFGGVIAAVAAVTAVLLVVTVVVPLLLLGAGLAVGFALLLALVSLAAVLGLALGAAALVLLLVTSPLWLLGLLVWWALKPSKPAAPAVASAPSA